MTYGNIPLADCLCNTILLLSRVRAEIQWRQRQGHDPGFEALRASRPTLATGPTASLLDDHRLDSIFQRKSPSRCDGSLVNGLHDVAGLHPDQHQISDTVRLAYSHFYHSDQATTIEEMKRGIASNNEHEMQVVEQELQYPDALFHATQTAAHEEILRLLREHEENTVTIVALGPLTNIALAMAKDATTFSRVKELVIMGGSLAVTDNSDVAVLDNCGKRTMAPDIKSICSPVQASSVSIEPPFGLTTQPQGPIRDALNLRNRVSPKAEYNTFADPLAAAYIYNSTTCPMVATRVRGNQGAAYQDKYHHSEQPRATDLTLFTHDVTVSHALTQDVFQEIAGPLVSIGSPLAMWLRDTLTPSLEKPTSDRKLSLNDPLCIMYCLAGDEAFHGRSGWEIAIDQNIKVHVTGQWTKGATALLDKIVKTSVSHDLKSRNRLRRCVGIPDKAGAGRLLLSKIFGQLV